MSTATRGAYAKSHAKRALIARAAYEIVLEVGHRALTTSAVAERAGISERTMQYHLPTRDDLLVAALRHADSVVPDALDHPEAMERVELWEMPMLLTRRDLARPQLLSLRNAIGAHADEPDHPAHAYQREHDERAVAMLALAIENRQRKGSAHPDLEPVETARQLLAVWAGLERQWMVNPCFDLAAVVGSAFRSLTGQPAMEARQALLAVVGQL